MKHKVEFYLTDDELDTILKYGEKSVSDMAESDIESILSRMAIGMRSRILDEPHYAYDDYVE